MSYTIDLTIDGIETAVPAGTTILDAARKVGVHIPTLCYLEHITPNGLCRLCVVETEGTRGLQAACVTEVRPGSEVRTRSLRIDRARRTILKMLVAAVDLSEAPGLQDLLEEYEALPEGERGSAERGYALLDDNPVYVRDYSKCVMCWRCVQICAEDAQYTYAIALGGRGYHSRITTNHESPLPETTCVFCGNCVGVCPTGALKGKREYLLEQGIAPDEILEVTRLHGKGLRARRSPRADGM